MEPIQIRTEQPSAAKKRRGPGRLFTPDDPRINRGGVPSEIRAFHNWMRESFAKFLREGDADGLTNGEQIVMTLIQKAKAGDMEAIKYVFDRMGGRPQQFVELTGGVTPQPLTEAEIAQLDDITAMMTVVGAGEGALPSRSEGGREN